MRGMYIFFPVLLTACGGGGNDDTVCTAEAAVSVSVYVIDGYGATVEGASVTYTVDGGDRQTANCLNDVCFAGYEVAGDFVITASYDWSSADGCCWISDSASASVTVVANECHVEGQSVTIELDTIEVCVDQGDTGDCLG